MSQSSQSQTVWPAERGPDPASPATERWFPTAAGGLAEMNRHMAALAAARQPVAPPVQRGDLKGAEAALTDALARRDEALAAYYDQVGVIDRAEAATAAAMRACEEYADVETDVASHYASLMAAGRPLELTPAIRQRQSEKRTAVEHRDACQAAQLQIHVATEPFKQALDRAEGAVTSAGLALLKHHGDAWAERVSELRQQFLDARSSLASLGAAVVNGQRLSASQMGRFWVDQVSPIAEGEATQVPSGLAEWNQRVRGWLAGRV